MEFLRKLILQTKAHLAGLTTSQRLAIGACAALVMLSIFWLLSWAGQSDMVPLFDQSITAEELGPIRQQLDSDGIKYTISGDRILVPSGSVMQLQAQLAQSNALPQDISITFDKLIANSSPWFSRDEQDWRRNVALANELSLRLRQFNGVRDARVFLDKTTRRTIGPVAVAPTASVQITMQANHELDKAQARAMASFVSRAVAGLQLQNVQVTDTQGHTFSGPRPGQLADDDDLEYRQKKENYFATQIHDLLDNIPGIRVAVRADLDPRTTEITDLKHGKPVAVKDRSKTMESNETNQASEPGLVPNSSSPNGVAGGGSRTEESETETTYSAEQDVTKTVSAVRPYRLISLSASINVPRSFLAGIYKQANDGKEPSDDELDAAASTKNALSKIKTQVETLMPKSEEAQSQVAVAWFHDNASLMLGGAFGSEPARAFSSDNVMQLVQMYGSKAGLAGLAVVSLFMMLMMVRRVGEGPVLPGEEPPSPLRKRKADEELDELDAGDDTIGEAEATEHLLVGREVDDSTLRSQKLVEQVAELVKQDPDMAVGVLQRWIDAENN